MGAGVCVFEVASGPECVCECEAALGPEGVFGCVCVFICVCVCVCVQGCTAVMLSAFRGSVWICALEALSPCFRAGANWTGHTHISAALTHTHTHNHTLLVLR